MAESEQTLEIHDPEINVEEIMQRIQERIQQRRRQAQAQGQAYDRPVDFAGEDRLAAELHQDLQGVRHSANSLGVSLVIRDQHIPLLNPLLMRLKHMLHALVILYVNLLAGQQKSYNNAVAQVLTGLVGKVEAGEARVTELEAELARVREQLARLETPASSTKQP